MKKETGKGTKIGEAMGIDLSDKTARFCHIDRVGEVKASGQVQLTAEGLKKEFGKLPGMRMVIESGGQSGWVMRCLAGMGHEVIVANPRALPSITGSTRKSDERDAEQLGRLARLDVKLLKPVTVRDQAQQLDLMRIRTRALLVDTRTKLVVAARGLAKLEGVRIPSASTDHFAQRATSALTGKLLAVLSPLLEMMTNSASRSRRVISRSKPRPRRSIQRRITCGRCQAWEPSPL